MKLVVPQKNYSITELYDTVANLIGKGNLDNNYDCRHINVAANIQDGFFACYREMNPDLSELDFRMSMTMMLLQYGPKVDETLKANEVEVFDGFLC